MTKHNGKSREEVVEIINSLLVTHKKSITYGMPIAQLDSEYREQDGIRIPFRELGYPTLLEFLQSLQRSNEIVLGKRDSMTVVYPCVNERIAHVSSLVARQKDSSNKRHARGGRRATVRCYPKMTYMPVEPPRLDSHTLADVVKLIKKTPDGMQVDKILEYVQDRNHCNMNKEHLIRQLRELRHEVQVDYNTAYPILNCNRQYAGTTNSPRKNESSSNGYAAQQTSSTGIRPAGDSDNDEETYDFNSPEKKDGNNERRLPPGESNNVGFTNLENKDERVAYEESRGPPNDENANGYHGEDESREANADDDVGILVNSRTRFRLEKLVQQHPEGIWCADLPKLYQREYCIPLNYEDLGFTSVSDLAAHLPDVFYCVRPQENGDFKLFDAKAPQPEVRRSARPAHPSLAELHNIYQYYGEHEEAVPVLLSSTTSQRLVPEGVMVFGETVAQINVTALFPDESVTIDVVVVDVITPTFFWIQLMKDAPKFTRFMTDLHAFYSSNASKYVIPIVLLEKGLNCACIYDGKWHRGLIKTVKPDNTVTVMFYDYGTVLSYPPEDIHFLHRSFSALAAQAIPCGLYNVRPTSSDKWSCSVSKEFVAKVLDVPLVAMLGSIDEENNSMLIALTDTNEPVDVHINDWMVKSGYAVYGKMGDTVDLNETYDDSIPFVASPATGGLPGQASNLYTIAEEAIDSSAVRNLQFQYLQLEKRMLTIEQAIQQLLRQNTDLKGLEESFQYLSIDDQTERRISSPQPPPIPPRCPNFVNVANLASNGVEYEQEMFNVNGYDYVQDNINLGASFQKQDADVNPAINPFNDPTRFTLTPGILHDSVGFRTPLHEFDSNSSSVDDDQLRMGSATSNSVHSTAPQAQGGFHSERDTASSDSLQLGFKDPIDLVKARKSFEFSLEESAKDFFGRLEAKSKAKIRDSNPFASEIEDTKIFGNNGSPTESAEPSRTNASNPFVSGGETIQREKISQTRVVYKADPVMYDLSGKDGTRSKSDASDAFGRREQEASEASNLYAWTEEGRRSKQSNHVGKRESLDEVPNASLCDRAYLWDWDFTNRAAAASSVPANVPPPIPPRPQPPSANSEVAKTSVATATEWLKATERVKAWNAEKSAGTEEGDDEDSRWDIAVGGPTAVDSERADAGKRETGIDREYRVNGESAIERKDEVVSAKPTWYFQEVPLTTQSVYLIQLDNEGWLTVEEFVAAFVTTKLQSKLPEPMLKILKIQNAQIPFRFIQRFDYPTLFESLESTSLAVARNHNNRIGDTLHLVPIKSILKILRQLRMTNKLQIELALEKQIYPQNSPQLFDASTVISAYAKIQRNRPL